MTGRTAEKNVEAQLLKAKVFRRKPGDVPYPVEPPATTSIFDVWDNMFFRSHCKGLTMCQFDKPPPSVLDLGCGSGYWVIEAAKQWQTSAIVGFDLHAHQPRLSLFSGYLDVENRVRWMHGNLLDGLPFPPSSFDFVRIANIGLGVPEDEWQHVFEEVARVMKPGAAIEVIEEDPIFPCAHRPSLPPHGRLQLPPLSFDGPLLESPPSSVHTNPSSLTLVSDSSSTLNERCTLDERFDLSPPGQVSSCSYPSIPTPPSGLSPTTPYNAPPFFQVSRMSAAEEILPDLRDHSRLKTAWEAMLSTRFISSNLSNVLPFYFSSLFTDVQIHQPFKILLPQNSGATLTRPRELSLTESLSLAADPGSLEKDDDQRHPYGTSWHNMHLAKVVNTVRGCKRSIWEEYKILYAAEFKPTAAARTLPAGARLVGDAPLREAFEEEWSLWENDMLDRIGLRRSMLSMLGWAEPPGDKPEWHMWRSLVDKYSANESPSYSASQSRRKDLDLCRSIRVYVGWKP